ncbi:hypothetical protein EMPS_09063 [Entomortierella parvispora]|uniref:Galactose oxidase n=1 Tax=Entomortierella parvispora TaxID=205924 RepID=A0A9P3LZX2_9FUNG|nr:hypothetical protein EMPS_09063 [Entomortierella parvispora]
MLRAQPKIRFSPSLSTYDSPSTSTSPSLLYSQSLLPTLLLLLLLISNLSVQINAQPQPVGGAAAALVGKQWFVQGGALSGDNILQSFWCLDLTKSWTTARPAWTSLPLGPPNAYHSAGFSADNSTFLTFGRDTAAAPPVIPPHFVNIYNIQSGVWSFVDPVMADNTRRDFVAVTDPSLNKIFFTGGDAGPAGAIASNMFDEYDTATNTLKESTNPPTAPQSLSTYAAAWVPRLNAMLVIGGATPTGISSALFMYLAATGTWTVQASTGPFVIGRTSACAASNADGSKVIVYGGFVGGAGSADNAIYILDTTTWNWTATSYPGKGRGNAVCTVVGDTVLIWGGFYASPNTLSMTPLGTEALLLFSISKKSWLSNYTPTGSFAPATTTQPGGGNITSASVPSPVPSTMPNQGGISKAAIGGIAAGAAVLLIAIAFALVERQKRVQEKELRMGDNADGRGLIVKSQGGEFYSPSVGSTGRSRVPGQYTPQQSPHDSQFAMLQSSYPQVPPPRPPPPPPGATPIGQYESLDTQEYPQEQGVARESRRYSDLSCPGTLQYLPTSEYGYSSELRVVNPGGRESALSDGSGYFPPPLPSNSSAMILHHQDALYFKQLAQRGSDSPVKRLSNGPHAIIDIASPFTNEYFPRNGNNPQSLPSESADREHSPQRPPIPPLPYTFSPPITLSPVTASLAGSTESGGRGMGVGSSLGVYPDQYHDHDRERELEQESQRQAERAAKHASAVSYSDVSSFNPLTLYFNHADGPPVPPLSTAPPKRLSDPQGGYGFGSDDNGHGPVVLGSPQGLPSQPPRQAANMSIRSATTAATHRQQQQLEGYI